VGEGVSELRINYGPGYRVYLAQERPAVVLLLCAGSKRTQVQTSTAPSLFGETTGVEEMPRSISYHEYLRKSLKKRREAEAYLNAALEDRDPRVFLLALRDVADARGGMSKAAAGAKLNRESLYRMLSKKGNPNLQSLTALLSTLGFRLAVEAEDAA
jgi:probable addiction module antidote protein